MATTNPLSVVLITYNEEKHIADAVKSAQFANEILVLDSGSTDRTCQIAAALGAKVEQQEWLGFGKQKQRAVALSENDWVFVLDADERITKALQEEIIQVLETPQYSAYFVPRLNYFWGKPIRHGGLYPDSTIRLFDRRKAHFDDAPVHESVHTAEKTGTLASPMEHLAYESIEAFITKQNRYSTLHHKKPNRLKALFNPCWTFFKLYIIKRGFLDGWDGFVIARLYAQYTFWKYVK